MANEMSNDKDKPKDAPGVVALPPVIFAAAIAGGFALEFLAPTAFAAPGSHAVSGIVLLAAGVVIMGLGLLEHRRNGNDPDPRQADVTVMTRGIYRRTRNPIYVGYILVQAGIGIWADSWWVLGMLIPAFLVIRYGVVAREEAYLEAKFGQTYTAYKKSVRRWI